MKMLIANEHIKYYENFPYESHKWQYGFDVNNTSVMDSLLYYTDYPLLNPPEGFSYVFDLKGLEDWYYEITDEEEREQYQTYTIYEYISCELGRCVMPVMIEE